MIYRNIISNLQEWSKRSKRKPLVLRGARQVGKTTLVDQFGVDFPLYLKLNLEEPEHIRLFEFYENMETLLTGIYLVNGVERKDTPTLLFIDEIQNSPRAVSLLRYFYEKTPQLHVVAAGSLLESLVGRQISFPVGRVEYMAVHPCSFNEFLGAMGNVELKKAQQAGKIPESLHPMAINLFNQYALIGGMPEVVAQYTQNRDVLALGRIYNSLLSGYQDDTEKYAQTDSMRHILRHIVKTGWNYAGQRIKFERFGESDYRSREVGEAFRLLERAMLLELVYPNSGYRAPILPELKRSPKLLWLDTGIVNYVAGIQKELFHVKDVADAWRGNIAEHIVGQELLSGNILFPDRRNFWVRNAHSSEAEVDFIIQHNNQIIPVEVKSGHNSKLRSLHLFMDEVDHTTAVRIWSGKFSIDKVVTPKGKTFYLYNIPFYYAGIIETMINRK
ncbi:MAG: AAA family ATPase [Prevotellaceae bacterium]|jgi:predicted AAA+ superfamily ATPase|nr:AAA family ATPase [Prevotellaceae bacterium]